MGASFACSHFCLLIELRPICNSMTAALRFNNCETHSLFKSYNACQMENGKTITGLDPLDCWSQQGESNPTAVSIASTDSVCWYNCALHFGYLRSLPM